MKEKWEKGLEGGEPTGAAGLPPRLSLRGGLGSPLLCIWFVLSTAYISKKLLLMAASKTRHLFTKKDGSDIGFIPQKGKNIATQIRKQEPRKLQERACEPGWAAPSEGAVILSFPETEKKQLGNFMSCFPL